MRELNETHKARRIEGLPESYLALWCPGLQGHGAKILDRSVNANHHTPAGATWKRTARGVLYLDFTNSTDLVNFGSPAYYDSILNATSMEAWVNPRTLGGSSLGTIFYVNSLRFYLIATAAAVFLVRQGGNFPNAQSNNNTVPAGTWTHLVGVYDGAYIILYTNTTASDATVLTGAMLNHDAENLYMGNRGAADRNFNGGIALARWYSRALSTAEITRHYTRERHMFGV